MKDSDGLVGSSNASYRLFTAVKYLVYLLLSFNTLLFLQEELTALEHTFVGGFKLSEVIQVFSATIDTAAWVVLLLLFELETSVISDKNIKGPVKWALHWLRVLCYVAVFYAFTGYYAELTTLYDTLPLAEPACALAGDWSLLVGLDEYEPLSAANCALAGGEAVQLRGFDIMAGGEPLANARGLAWTDVINSGTWLLIVIALEVEVRMQLRGKLTPQVMPLMRNTKLALYALLFVCAGYWGITGSFLDFWDAALWLFAFIFIELNVFEWQHETRHTRGESRPTGA